MASTLHLIVLPANLEGSTTQLAMSHATHSPLAMTWVTAMETEHVPVSTPDTMVQATVLHAFLDSMAILAAIPYVTQ